MRPNDLFFGAASFDPKPDWVDFNKIAIPQADEQQRLLANMIISMNADRGVLPRFCSTMDTSCRRRRPETITAETEQKVVSTNIWPIAPRQV